MLLWLILAAMTAAAVAAVLQPLRRRTSVPAAADAPVVAVYRDQLAEIEADVERGLINTDEAAAAGLEVQRRLLKQTGNAGTPVTATAQAPVDRPANRAALATALLVPVLAISAYALLGSPHLPDQPLATRRAASPETAQVEILVARVEERLRTHPEDGQGWEVIAPVYARLGREQDALDAWRQAIRLLGPSPQRLRGLVEASLATSQGIVGDEARAALEKLRAADPADPIPRFWLAIAKQQNGQRAVAIADFKALLDEAPADAPWRKAVADRLAALTGNTQPPAPSPSPEQRAAAQQMAPDDRSKMIAGMVDGLAARLAKDGTDIEGWLRLINAYVVLGRTADAQSAIADARKAHAQDSQALSRLTALAGQLGL